MLTGKLWNFSPVRLKAMARKSEPLMYTEVLELKPESASLLDLLRLLYSWDNVHKIDCVQCLEPEKLRILRHRWVIFMSIVTLKGIHVISRPLAKAGTMIEQWLNLVPCNGGFKPLLLKFLRGEVVKPDRSSANYATFMGHLDPRVELDKSIHTSDPRYGASLSIMAAKLSYENENYVKTVIANHWKMEFLGFYEFWNNHLEKHSTHAIMFYDPMSDLILVAFRGTGPFDIDALNTDFDTGLCQVHPEMGLIHSGFMRALGIIKGKGWPRPNTVKQQNPDRLLAYYTLRQQLREILKAKKETTKFILTGHSLGGALAILFVSVLIYHEERWLADRLEGVYTFGQPKVGNDKFAEFMKVKMREYGVKYLRYVYGYDLVPRLPTDYVPQLFKHFGRGLYFNSRYKGKLTWEEPNKHFFTPRWALHKYLDSIWELLRSFTIQYTRGPDYKPSWLSIMMRVFGLLITGFSAHIPQNYVNVTRLGSLPFDLQKLIHEEHLKYD